MPSLTFRSHRLLATLTLLTVEVAIARSAPPGGLRGFGGDVLVVVLVCALLQRLRGAVSRTAGRQEFESDWRLIFMFFNN